MFAWNTLVRFIGETDLLTDGYITRAYVSLEGTVVVENLTHRGRVTTQEVSKLAPIQNFTCLCCGKITPVENMELMCSTSWFNSQEYYPVCKSCDEAEGRDIAAQIENERQAELRNEAYLYKYEI